MRRRENKVLDEIGKAVVKADVLSPRDVEKIISNPALFDSVRARLELEPDVPATRRTFFRPAAVAFASVALVTAAALAFVVFKSTSSDVVVKPVVDTPTPVQTKRFTEPDKVVDTGFVRTSTTSVKAEKISTKPNIKINRPKRSTAQQIRYEDDFYALSYAGDPNETERGGRIVRVDVPRSTLFAMGVDIPLENEAETVKADLLVGSDGVTRAIRVVK